MTAKSVISIDVQDEAFKRFQAAFDRYQKVLDEQSKKWEKVGKTLDTLNKKQKDFNKSVNDGNVALRKAAVTTGSIARNMASAALSAAKWVAFGAIGGGFGLGALASSASDYRRRSQGYGVSTGQLRAAELAYGRAFDANSVLSKVSSLQNTPQGTAILDRLGLGEGETAGENLGKLYKNAVDLFEQFGKSPVFAESLGLTKVFDLEDLIRGSNKPRGELDELPEQDKKYREFLATSDKVNKAWEDFWYGLKKSGQIIETSFIKALKDLVPQLTRLSETVANAIVNLLSSKEFQKAVQDFADTISSGEFQAKVGKFFNALGQLADGMINVMRKLGLLPEDQNAQMAHDKRVQFGFAKKEYDAMSETQKKWFRDPAKDLKILDLEEKYSLPIGILDSVWAAESDRGKNKGRSPAGAEGDFQFIPKTAKEFGLKNPYDFVESADAAARKLKGLLRYYKNDPEKALAAYNWGEGNLDKDIREHGSNWKEHLVPETKKYLEKNQAVIITINNNTGSNTSVTAPALQGAQGASR